MILAVINSKGGCGKTTLATSIAVAWHQADREVVIVDADIQGSASRWSETRDGPPTVVALHRGALIRSQVPNLAQHYDHVIIDTPPSMAEIQRNALRVAELLVIPVCLGGLETWALDRMLEALNEENSTERRESTPLRAVLVLNKNSRTRLARSSGADLRKDSPIPVLASALGYRTAFAEAVTAGQSVEEWSPRSSASSELAAFMRELNRYAA